MRSLASSACSMLALSSTLVASGFSQTTCAPCSSASSVCSAWTAFGVQTWTTSTPPAASNSDRESYALTLPPISAASASAPEVVRLDTATTVPPRSRTAAACTRATNPERTIAVRSSVTGLVALGHQAARARFQKHLRQHGHVQTGLLRRGAALGLVHDAVVEMHQLAGEALFVRLEGLDDTRIVLRAGGFVERRRLLEPRRRKAERVNLFGEIESHRLAVLVDVEQLDPGAVPACTVCEAHGSGHSLTFIPPVAVEHLGGQGPAKPLQQAVHDVDVVDEAAEERALECGDHRRAVVADRRFHLRAHLLATRVEHLRRDVRAANDLARPEERHEFRVMHHDADVPERLGGFGQVLEHPLPGAIEALHVADLHDFSGLLPRVDDPVCIGERDAHRFLDEDV